MRRPPFITGSKFIRAPHLSIFEKLSIQTAMLVMITSVWLGRSEVVAGGVLQPQVVGDWWQIAAEPDLGGLSGTNQRPVDFGIWQAADGTWQAWSCIRNTKEAGHHRLFYGWEGKRLTDRDWRGKGIVMRAETRYGEAPGGLQAPYVFRDADRFVMFYGGWDSICSASSRNGRNFERILDSKGNSTIFGGEPGNNPRDPMVIRIGNLWHCYYTMHPWNVGADYCRTSGDLIKWGEPHLVSKGGRAGTGPWPAECPL